MKKSALVTVGSLLAVFGAVAAGTTQTACLVSINGGDAAVDWDAVSTTYDGSSATGGDGGGGGGDTGGSGCSGLDNVSFNDPQNASCDTCMASSCCAEVTTCFGDKNSECTVVFTCLDACTNKACEDDCVAKVSADGTAQLRAVEGCLKNKCDPQCPAPVAIPNP